MPVADIGHVPTRRLGIAGDQLGPPREPRKCRRGEGPGHPVSGFRPERQQVAQVGERFTERAQLPVHDADHFTVVDPGDHVAHVVVAVHQCHLGLIRGVRGKRLGDLGDLGDVLGLGVFPLRRPALELSGRKRLLARQIVETDLGEVDRMNGAQCPRQTQPDGSPPFGRQFRSHRHIVDHNPVDITHQHKRGVCDSRITGGGDHLRHRHRGVLQCRHDPVFAQHVMCRCQQRSQWRATENPVAATGVPDAVRQIGLTVADTRKRQRGNSSDVETDDPFGDQISVDPDGRTHAFASVLR